MSHLNQIYQTSLSLLTDLYQLTMAYGYFKQGIHEKRGIFNLFFRKNPFSGGYTIAAGLDYIIEFLKDYHFTDSDIAYLSTLKGNDQAPLFDEAFLNYLKNMKFSCTLHAVEEGNLVFPHEPLLRIEGPLIQAQLLETTLLNIMNFQTLIATKSSRIVAATNGENVLEFGLRRAQGVDGGLSASRAAFIGGCSATSNVLAGKIFDIPVKGTHAHSWVMSFNDELEAFRKYAEAMPNNSLFLVDTYDTLEGVKKAILIGKELEKTKHNMLGIRLDSGDLAYLSIEARKLLDEAGFPQASIVASNDLDEFLIQSLKNQGAKINIWGVGTKLVTAYDQPALGGVYKLSAIENEAGKWEYKIKLSEQKIKISNPGKLNIRRFISPNQHVIADMIFDETLGVKENTIIDPKDATRRKSIPEDATSQDILIPIFDHGKLIYQSPSLLEIQKKAKIELQKLHSGIKRFANPHEYPVGLEMQLNEVKTKLILKARGVDHE